LRKAQSIGSLIPRLQKPNDLTQEEEREIEQYLLSTRNGTVPLTIEQLYNAFCQQRNVRFPQKTREFMKAFFEQHEGFVEIVPSKTGQIAYFWKRGV